MPSSWSQSSGWISKGIKNKADSALKEYCTLCIMCLCPCHSWFGGGGGVAPICSSLCCPSIEQEYHVMWICYVMFLFSWRKIERSGSRYIVFCLFVYLCVGNFMIIICDRSYSCLVWHVRFLQIKLLQMASKLRPAAVTVTQARA